MSIVAWTALLSLTAALAQEKPMTLLGRAPCNVFAVGEPLAFDTSLAGAPALTCTVRDYDGVDVWHGSGDQGRLSLPAQPPGYYEIEWQAGEKKGKVSFAVTPARPDEPPPSGPLAVDGATAWLVSPDEWEPIARMLRRAGIGWMRERLSWGAVQRDPNKIDWDRYQTVADIISAQGVREYQIFHDSPDWTHPGKDTRCPDDLRTVYRFTKEAAQHFAGKILAWEPWNEPDISFFDQLGDKYAGIQKAAFLGFRAGNPEALVLSCSFCRGRSAFSDNVFESGAAGYMDVFNFHTYNPIDSYTDTIRSWVDLAKTYRVGDRPIWLTEAGVRLEHTDKELTPERERIQAEFVPRSFAISLAGGVDRHFFFVLPFYPEGPIQFGALHRDLSPRPALVAIATAVRFLGEGRYLGKLPVEGAEVHVFDSGKERVAVAWALEPTEVRVPVGGTSVRVADLVGREREAEAPGGALTLTVGPAAQYILGLGQGVRRDLTGETRPPGKRPRLDPSKVVVVGYFGAGRLDKDANHVVVEARKPVPFTVDVYNMDEAKPATGRVRLRLPKGWQADRAEAELKLTAMGRESLALTITPGASEAAQTAKVRVEGDFPGPRVAPSVSYARVDLSSVEPARREALGLDKPEAWQRNVSGNGRMGIRAGAEGGVSFPITFAGEGDRWCYPRAAFARPQDWRKFQALALEYRFDTDDRDTVMRAQLIETGGSAYISPAFPASKEWRRALVLWTDCGYGPWSARDADGKLDLDQIGGLLVGCNTKLGQLTLEVRRLEVVTFE
jgi:hypothetical protein